jgi:hypothetical protein
MFYGCIPSRNYVITMVNNRMGLMEYQIEYHPGFNRIVMEGLYIAVPYIFSLIIVTMSLFYYIKIIRKFSIFSEPSCEFKVTISLLL